MEIGHFDIDFVKSTRNYYGDLNQYDTNKTSLIDDT